MRGISLKSFSDEVVKIARATTPVEKSAAILPPSGIIRNIGNNLRHTVSGVGGNLRHAVSDFRHPVTSLREGANYLKADWNALPTGRFPKAKQWAARGMILGDALGAPEALAKNDPTDQGRSRAERVGNWVGSAAGGVMTARRGISGALLGSVVGGAVGGRAGRAIKGRKPQDRFRSQVPAEAQPAPGQPPTVPAAMPGTTL